VAKTGRRTRRFSSSRPWRSGSDPASGCRWSYR
jgi:hypothetical protein